MPKTSKARTDFGKSGRGKRPLVQRNTPSATTRLVATTELMGSGDNLALPRLDAWQ